MSEPVTFCTFYLERYLFGIDVLSVQEVLREQRMTRVPGAPPIVRGLINLRGQVVTAIDLRRRLGLEPLPEGRPSMNVVVRTDDGVVSFLVDDIGDVVELDAEDFEGPPQTLRGPARDLVTGVTAAGDALLLSLDVEAASAARAADPHPASVTI